MLQPATTRVHVMWMNLLLFLLCVAHGRSTVEHQRNSNTICSTKQDDRIRQLEKELSMTKNAIDAGLEILSSNFEVQQKWRRETLHLMKRNLDELVEASEDGDAMPDPVSPTQSAGACTNYEHLRLVNGSNSNEGRLQVKVGDVWMNVCEDNWSTKSAQIICSMLGHPGRDAAAVGGSIFGNGQDPVLPSSGSCGYSAGAICGDFEQYKVRLVNGSRPSEGRVEVFVGGQWGTVCHDNWQQPDAQVVCRMLGYSGSGATATDTHVFGQGTGPVWMRYLNCQGDEGHLLTCPASYPTGYRSQCSHSTDVGVICDGWNNYPVRLVNGSSSREGRVEMQIHGEWGTVCHDNWDDHDAQVVCNMLGFHGFAAKATMNAFFGEGHGPVWMTYLGCRGNEDHILSCPSDYSSYAVGYPNVCGHAYDAGVICGDWSHYPVRLVQGPNEREGRVEVRINGQWTAVYQANWDDNDAKVVCRMLGYNWQGAKAVMNSHYGSGTGPQYIGYVNCAGTEQHLFDCPWNYPLLYTNWNSHGSDAGVMCPP